MSKNDIPTRVKPLDIHPNWDREQRGVCMESKILFKIQHIASLWSQVVTMCSIPFIFNNGVVFHLRISKRYFFYFWYFFLHLHWFVETFSIIIVWLTVNASPWGFTASLVDCDVSTIHSFRFVGLFCSRDYTDYLSLVVHNLQLDRWNVGSNRIRNIKTRNPNSWYFTWFKSEQGERCVILDDANLLLQWIIIRSMSK